MAFQYFNDTGIEGGNANAARLAEHTFYVDSYKGSDVTGDGSNTSPFKSIQQALTNASQYFVPAELYRRGADIILSGYFNEGDWSSLAEGISLIAEGNVVIDGTGYADFNPVIGNRVELNVHINYNLYEINGNIRKRRKYGRFTIQNYTGDLVLGASNAGQAQNLTKGGVRCYDATFDTADRFGYDSVYGTKYYNKIAGCVFRDISDTIYGFSYNPGYPIDVRNCSYFNCAFVYIGTAAVSSMYSNYTSCYFDPLTKIYISSFQQLAQYGKFNYNHVEGDTTDKIYYNGSYYTNRALARTNGGGSFFDPDGREHTDDPEFNAKTEGDYTYPNSAVNATAGLGGNYIGAYGIADNAQNVDNANWIKPSEITILGTGVNSKAVLNTSGSYAMVTNLGIALNVAKDVYLKRVTLPNVVNDYANGGTVDADKSADDGSPSMLTVEIKTSLDDVTYSTNWIKVPYEGTPLIDATGKGNGDPAFDPNTATRIILRYIKYKITLRDDEVTLP